MWRNHVYHERCYCDSAHVHVVMYYISVCFFGCFFVVVSLLFLEVLDYRIIFFIIIVQRVVVGPFYIKNFNCL